MKVNPGSCREQKPGLARRVWRPRARLPYRDSILRPGPLTMGRVNSHMASDASKRTNHSDKQDENTSPHGGALLFPPCRRLGPEGSRARMILREGRFPRPPSGQRNREGRGKLQPLGESLNLTDEDNSASFPLLRRGVGSAPQRQYSDPARYQPNNAERMRPSASMSASSDTA